MKKIILFTAIIMVGTWLHAQEIFFPTNEGTVLVYKTFDKKEKEINQVRYTITQLKNKGTETDITYLLESIDPKDKLVFKDEITISQKGDKLYMDMSNFVNKAAFQQNGEIPSEVTVTGNNLEIPSNPTPGDVLPDANVTMGMSVGFINMKVSAEVTNRKVEAIENLTVKAGTFKTYKFSSEVNSTALGLKTKSRSIEWYAKGVGIVKSETYDKNDKLVSYMELIELKK